MTRLSLNLGNYTDDQVTSALVTDGRRLRFLYEHLDGDGNSLGLLKGVTVGAKITYTFDAQIKRTMSFTLNESDDLGDEIDYDSDRVKPFMGVLMPDGGWADVPLGVFVLSSAERKYDDGSITRDVTGYDLAQVLVDDKVEVRYVVKKGTAYTDAIALLLAPFDSFISDSSSVMPGDQVWEPGTAKYDIVSDLIKGVGFGTLWFDANGVAQCLPFVAPADGTSGWTYATGDQSVISGSTSQTIDLFAVPNVFVRVITVSGRPLLSSRFENANPDSPTSTVNRGRRITDWAEANDAADQAALDTLCRKAAAEASQVHDTVELETRLMPFHQDSDIVTVTHDGLGLSADYQETGWDMSLTVGGSMTHALKGVVSIDAVDAA